MKIFEPIIKTADLISIYSITDSGKEEITVNTDSYSNAIDGYDIFALSGLVYPNNIQPVFYSFSDRSLSEFNEKIDDLNGQWVAVLTNEKQDIFKVLADHFGFQSVFYRYDNIDDHSSQLVISTNYNSLIEYSNNNLLSCTFNDEQFYLAMGATNIHLRTAFSSKSFCREINLLGVDEFLLFDIKKDLFKVHKKPFLFDPQNRSYEELINTGIEKAKRDIESISNFYEDKRISLSGGRDSRMVLALLSSLGLSKDYSATMGNPYRYAGNSRNVVQKDLYVSTYLTNKYKIKPTQVYEHLRLSLTFKESLERILSHGSQFSWKEMPGNIVTFPAHDYLALRGGGGELIRDFGSSQQAINKLEISEPNFKELDFESQVDKLFGLFVDITTIPKAHLDNCKALFSESFTFNKDFSLEQNIDWHYDYYRNRVHFGHYVNSFSRNETAFHPLMQKEFLYAANHYDLETRRSGKICYDIIEKLDPELNNITFDDGYWASINSKIGPTIEELSNDVNAYEEYYELQEKNLLLERRPLDINNLKISPEELFSHYKVYSLTINILMELVYESKYKVKNIVSIIQNINSKKVSALELFLKFIDYKNSCEEYNTYYNSISFNKPFHRKYVDNINTYYPKKLLLSKISYFNNLNYEFTIDEELCFKVNLNPKFNDIFDKVEYAFYLYEGEVILDKSWYSENNEYNCKVLEKGKKYTVQFFLRIFIAGKVSAPIIVRSNFISY